MTDTYGPNLRASLAEHQALRYSDNWIDQMLYAWACDRASMRDLIDHKDGDWPDHPVYWHRQGFGSLIAARWKEHEAKLRQAMDAGPASSYVDAKGNYDPTIDPVSRQHNAKAVIAKLQFG
jgi:hypothetical protein